MKTQENKFVEKLKSITKERSKKQKMICDKLEIAQSTVSTWYQGKAVPKYDKLKPLSDFLGVPISYWTDEPEEENYYIDPETREIAEKMRTDKNLKLLFSEAADATPEDLKATYLLLKALKDKEDKEQNTGD